MEPESKLKKKTAQEIQDEIFRKMPFSKKIRLASDLTMFCLKLNRLNGNNKSGKLLLKVAPILNELKIEKIFII